MGMNRGTAEAKLVEKLGLILTRVAFGVKVVSRTAQTTFLYILVSHVLVMPSSVRRWIGESPLC